MTRRGLAAALPALAITGTAMQASADTIAQASLLQQLIDEVIADGDMDNLDQIVAPDITIATLGVSGIDEFRNASIEGHEGRAVQYDTVAFDIQSIAENGDYAHALVRFEGKKVSGGMEARSLFYVALFRDGLISQLYLG